MTGNVLLDLGVALAAVIVLTGLSWVMFRRGRKTLTLDRAAERLSFDEPDFLPAAWIMDGPHAAARNEAGDLAVVSVHGDGVVTRRFRVGEARISYDGGCLIIDAADHTWRPVRIVHTPQDAARWLGNGRRMSADH